MFRGPALAAVICGESRPEFAIALARRFTAASARRKCWPVAGTVAVLWLAQADVMAHSALPASAGPEPTTPKPTRRLATLMVDDPLVLASTAGMLEDLGHTMVEAESGQEALDLRARPPGESAGWQHSLAVKSARKLHPGWASLPVQDKVRGDSAALIRRTGRLLIRSRADRPAHRKDSSPRAGDSHTAALPVAPFRGRAGPARRAGSSARSRCRRSHGGNARAT